MAIYVLIDGGTEAESNEGEMKMRTTEVRPSDIMETATKAAFGKRLEFGTSFYLYLGGAVCHSSVSVSGLDLMVCAETERAVQVQARNERGELTQFKCWLPRKALIEHRSDGALSRSFKLAPWFRADGYAAKFIDRNAIHGHVSVPT